MYLRIPRNEDVAASGKNEKEEKYYCSVCGREISKEEYETYSDLCEECHEIEIDELDYEDEHGC